MGGDGEGNGGGGRVVLIKDEVEEGEPGWWESDLCGCPKRLWPLNLLERIMAGMGHTYKTFYVELYFNSCRHTRVGCAYT